ncbi:MAG: HTH-type transcriptional regulator, sugar sensing transcriptional regulator [Patescibacteria group bacterium]|nr:HTH-type transcriptional regulator, sugar sensing transcriptional regulator [Patescibacteria group bacterium]
MLKNEKLLQILKDIGLQEDEANVYLASLSLGPTSVLKISKRSGIKRTTVYGIIEDLKQKGLMQIELKGLKQFYVAENPEKLEAVLERRKNEFQDKLPEFMALYKLKGGESTIKYYTGQEAMRNIYMETLKEIKPNEDYLVITNQDKWYNLDPNFADKYIEERSKLNIKTRLLFQDGKTAQEHKKFEKNFNQSVKILPKGEPLNVDTVLLPNKLITFELIPPYKTVIIENKSIVELHKEMFELIWQGI